MVGGVPAIDFLKKLNRPLPAGKVVMVGLRLEALHVVRFDFDDWEAEHAGVAEEELPLWLDFVHLGKLGIFAGSLRVFRDCVVGVR